MSAIVAIVAHHFRRWVAPPPFTSDTRFTRQIQNYPFPFLFINPHHFPCILPPSTDPCASLDLIATSISSPLSISSRSHHTAFLRSLFFYFPLNQFPQFSFASFPRASATFYRIFVFFNIFMGYAFDSTAFFCSLR